MKSSSFHKDKLILFLTGCALGAACFLWVYGAGILNPLYDAWLFNGDMDLRQHYIGFCHYRMSDWHFPFGLIDTLSYPTSVSVIYTDSIPLVALVFKLFNRVLPQHFQYFGIFGLVSFMLMGGLSSLLIFRFIDRDPIASLYDDKSHSKFVFVDKYFPHVISAAVSVVYIMSFTVLHRMYYHTALGAQWLIILAMYIWVSRDEYGKVKTCIIYGLMALLCVGIHTYYVPMIGSILFGTSLEQCIRDRSRIKDEIVNIICFCVFGLLTLYAFGGFYGVSEAYGWGIGSFTANLNTFINPLYGSIILKPFKLFYDFQYEGYSYLGIGVLLCAVVALVYRIGDMKREGFKNYLKSHLKFTVALVVLIVDAAFAILPTIAFNDFRILGINYPGVLNKIFGIFRSNGRFIWVPEYLIFTGAITGTFIMFSGEFGKKEKGRSIVLKIMLLAVVLQVLDTDRVVADKQAYFKEEQEYDNLWSQVTFPVDDPKYKEFVFMYNDNDIIMDTAFYAYLNGKILNNYYYARNMDDEINRNIEGWIGQLNEGIVRDDVIYIFKKDDLYGGIIDLENLEDDDGRNWLTWYELDDRHIAGFAE